MLQLEISIKLFLWASVLVKSSPFFIECHAKNQLYTRDFSFFSEFLHHRERLQPAFKGAQTCIEGYIAHEF